MNVSSMSQPARTLLTAQQGRHKIFMFRLPEEKRRRFTPEDEPCPNTYFTFPISSESPEDAA